MDQQAALYKHIERNDFLHRKHRKQKEEDIVVCECVYDPNDPDSGCGETCLNVLTSTECTPGYCPCGDYCKNQRFQKCEYSSLKLFKTDGCGWGLLAAENIKAGQFVIEYCGEVISCKKAKRRSQTYDAAGLIDAYIISLDANESIDATKKGSLARFINHSCQPNCETRKWFVLCEVRVGIFAKQDIPVGTELSYDYNFQWYGGRKVRCLCGAPCCSGFLGAKSRGFQEATYLWEDDDDRYSVENIPLYDSGDDEQSSNFFQTNENSNHIPLDDGHMNLKDDVSAGLSIISQPVPMIVEPLCSIPMEVDVNDEIPNGFILFQENFAQNSTLVPQTGSDLVSLSATMDTCPASKTRSPFPGGKLKKNTKKQINNKSLGERLASQEAHKELLACEERKHLTSIGLESLYDEIRPALVKHERDNPDSVLPGIGERWIEAHCSNLKADFDLSLAIINSFTSNFLDERTENGITKNIQG